jgi:hypothetical protein|nr:MAG TPA: hypothetical protein [Caudoviricetes sp.]
MKIYVLDESNYILAHEEALELRDWLDGQVERLGSWPIDVMENILFALEEAVENEAINADEEAEG